jgi:UDP-3-O-acyl-N-acetylglucosamine deacetylase
MTLKIERVMQAGATVFKLSGRIEEEHVEHLWELLKQTDVEDKIIDLEEVRLADRDAISFLAACEADGIKLQNCPAYIRNWIVIAKLLE